MLNVYNILETIRMIQDECLDIRTITMGISLLDCIDEDIDKACTKVYDKICRSAKDLVKTGCEIEKEFGIPIVKNESFNLFNNGKDCLFDFCLSGSGGILCQTLCCRQGIH